MRWRACSRVVLGMQHPMDGGGWRGRKGYLEAQAGVKIVLPAVPFHGSAPLLCIRAYLGRYSEPRGPDVNSTYKLLVGWGLPKAYSWGYLGDNNFDSACSDARSHDYSMHVIVKLIGFEACLVNLVPMMKSCLISMHASHPLPR